MTGIIVFVSIISVIAGALLVVIVVLSVQILRCNRRIAESEAKIADCTRRYRQARDEWDQVNASLCQRFDKLRAMTGVKDV